MNKISWIKFDVFNCFIFKIKTTKLQTQQKCFWEIHILFQNCSLNLCYEEMIIYISPIVVIFVLSKRFVHCILWHSSGSCQSVLVNSGNLNKWLTPQRYPVLNNVNTVTDS